jgi:hypothetical protein
VEVKNALEEEGNVTVEQGKYLISWHSRTGKETNMDLRVSGSERDESDQQRFFIALIKA